MWIFSILISQLHIDRSRSSDRVERTDLIPENIWNSILEIWCGFLESWCGFRYFWSFNFMLIVVGFQKDLECTYLILENIGNYDNRKHNKFRFGSFNSSGCANGKLIKQIQLILRQSSAPRTSMRLRVSVQKSKIENFISISDFRSRVPDAFWYQICTPNSFWASRTINLKLRDQNGEDPRKIFKNPHQILKLQCQMLSGIKSVRPTLSEFRERSIWSWETKMEKST